jgi:alpha-mannosidase
MKPSRLFVLLPCESLDSLDLHRSESDAEQLLSAWSALWHPELLAAAQSIPHWAAAAAPPEPSDFLAIVPACCEQQLPENWTAEAEAAGARVFRGLKNREEMLAAAIGVVREDAPHHLPSPEKRERVGGEGGSPAAAILPSPACGRGAGGEGGARESADDSPYCATGPHPSPLPAGEGTKHLPSPEKRERVGGEGGAPAAAILPSPACGRGAGGEGGARESADDSPHCATSPHPSPLPAGEGTIDLAADFLALGYCHLLVELITSRTHYTGTLNEDALQSATLAAAEAALAGDAESARRQLQTAFDRLHEAREYHYAVEPRLLDVTLVAGSTLGQPLRDELAAGEPRSLLVSGQVLERMACQEPETLEALKKALAAETVSLLGGEFTEVPLPLLGPEAIAGELRRGLDSYERHLGCRPTTFGRRRFGLCAALPQILHRLGFTAAFHCTLDDGQFPVGGQSRIQWEGIDGSTLGCAPLDAARADSFLLVAEKLAEASRLDHAAALVFAHWPGRASGWYDDLRRIASSSSVLGRFATIGGYFGETRWDSRHAAYKPDEYRAPYLRQDVAAGRPDPVSRWVRYARRRATLEACSGLRMLAAACGTSAPALDERLALAVEDALASPPEADGSGATLDADLAESVEQSLAGFSRSLTGTTAAAESGYLVVNPWSFSARAALRDRANCPPLAADAPAMGFAWVASAAEPAAPTAPPPRHGWFGGRPPKTPPPLAEERLLRNEFCEIQFDPQSGAIASVRDYVNRDPRFSQQIALRLPGPGEPDSESRYSIMAADEIAVTSAGPVLGEMTVRGRLLDRQGVRVARFRQTTRLWRASRVIELAVDLDIDRPPEADPWDSYYAVRLAWKDPAATIFRGVNMAVAATELRRIESPQFLDIRRAGRRTTLLCGGLPYHRRLGDRKLDTLLVVRGETARSFRLGVGIDVPHPMAAALGFLSPPLVLPEQPRPPIPTGWLFHLDCRNVLATHWEPLDRDCPNLRAGENGAVPFGPPVAGPDAPLCREKGGLPGFRVRLLELDGHSVRVRLRCFRAVASAQRIDGEDDMPESFPVDGDRAEIPIDARQWIEVEIRFR